MKHKTFGSNVKPTALAGTGRIARQRHAEWLGNLANWTHAITLTMTRTDSGLHPGHDEVLRRCRLFLNRLNCRWYKRRGTKRGYRIASAAFLGWGSYEDHPHVHWALEKPIDQSDLAFEAMLRNIAQTTAGIGEQLDIQQYYGAGWLSYMVDHGFEGWQPALTFAAKCPKH